MKKLYVVTIETEAAVVADSAEEAIRHVKRDWRDVVEPHVCSTHAAELDHIPGDAEEIPWGDVDPDDPDRTIQGWIDTGAAPKYQARLAKLSGRG